MQPQGDSIWGNINLCIEIALNIYYLCGEKGEGIVIPKEQAEKDFSPETVAAGKESDGYLYYPKGEAMEMFRQEMLQKRLVMIKKMELAATEQMEAGSIKESNTVDIFKSNQCNELIDFFRLGVKYMNGCDKCVWKSSCGRGCIALCVSNGSIQETDGNCYLRKKQLLSDLK